MSLMTHCIGCEEISSMIFINRWCWSRNLEVNKKKIRYISQFCFNNSEKVTQTAKILKTVHGLYTVAENNGAILISSISPLNIWCKRRIQVFCNICGRLVHREARCLGSTWPDAKASVRLYYHLQILDQSQQSRPSS